MVQTRYGMPEETYFQTRFEVLREPLGMPLGSERLEDDAEALHAGSCLTTLSYRWGGHMSSRRIRTVRVLITKVQALPSSHRLARLRGTRFIALPSKSDKWERLRRIEGADLQHKFLKHWKQVW